MLGVQHYRARLFHASQIHNSKLLPISCNFRVYEKLSFKNKSIVLFFNATVNLKVYIYIWNCNELIAKYLDQSKSWSKILSSIWSVLLYLYLIFLRTFVVYSVELKICYLLLHLRNLYICVRSEYKFGVWFWYLNH